jgi:hypothetical protein
MAALTRLQESVRRQLLDGLDATLGFADYCSFIGRDQVAALAEELAGIAQRLYEDTLSTMGTTQALRPTAEASG